MDVSLADLMRARERVDRLDVSWRPDRYLVVRCDGRGFSNYTRQLDKPFDDQFSRDMDEAAAALVSDVATPMLGYVQSDEISVVMSCPTPNSQWWFGGNLTKISSVAASCVTATFNQLRPGVPAMFDARCVVLDGVDELASYLMWRQRDARRNAIGMSARHHFSHRQLHGRSTVERVEMLAGIGVDVAQIDVRHTHGRIRSCQLVCAPVVYTDRRTGKTCTTDSTERRVWSTGTAPWFSVDAVAELISAASASAS